MGKCQTRLANIAQLDEDDDNALTMKSTMETSSMGEEGAPASAAPTEPNSLSIFHEDILLAILSYVADVPYEMADIPATRAPTDTHSTLTHTLPLVSKQFHRLARNHDLYWRQALLRLLHDEPKLWEEGMKRVIFNAKCDKLRDEITQRNRNRARRGKRTKYAELNQPQSEPQSQQPPSDDSKVSTSQSSEQSNNKPSKTNTAPTQSKQEELLQEACTTIESHPPRLHTATSSGKYQCMYQSIVLGHLRYQAPVFCMSSAIKLGSPYGLHFFEPRYRVMIAEVMATYPVGARRGERIHPVVPGLFPPEQQRGRTVMDGDIKANLLDLLEKNESTLATCHYPTFIHAHQSLRRNTPAAIVQVLQCDIQPDGSADVFLRPLAYIWLEEIWERPGTGGLVEARGIRMGQEASLGYERWCSMRGFGRGDGRGWSQMLPIP